MNCFLNSSDLSFTGKNNKHRELRGGRIFISDVHLGAFNDQQNRRIEEDLIQLVSFCENNGLQITLLGDIFDYWMEYSGHPPPVGSHILPYFRKFHERTGSHTLFVTGNHDNWTDGYLPSLGFDLEHEYRIIREANMSIMVLHGDGLSDPKMNLPRPILHRLLRNSYFVYLYKSLLPRRLGWHLMKTYSGLSRMNQNSDQMAKQRNKLDTWAMDKVESDPRLQAIIYGHHHKARLLRHGENVCVNCGFFGRDRTAALYTNGELELVKWEAGTYELQTVNTEESFQK